MHCTNDLLDSVAVAPSPDEHQPALDLRRPPVDRPHVDHHAREGGGEADTGILRRHLLLFQKPDIGGPR